MLHGASAKHGRNVWAVNIRYMRVTGRTSPITASDYVECPPKALGQVRSKIEESGLGNRWEFDVKKLFDHTNYMAERCTDLFTAAQVPRHSVASTQWRVLSGHAFHAIMRANSRSCRLYRLRRTERFQ